MKTLIGKEEKITEFSEFEKAVVENIRLVMGDDYLVKTHEVIKNNDNFLKAVVIKKQGNQISPSIYLEGFYEKYRESGVDIEEICDEIIRLYKSNCTNSCSDACNYEDYNFIKDKLCFKLVNAETNKQLLKEVPWFPYLDLAIVFYAIVEIDGVEGEGTILVRNNHLDLWGISREELLEVARMNTPKLMEADERTMQSIICDILKKKDVDTEEFMQLYGNYFDENMIVLSDKKMLFGASVLIYDGILEELSDRFNQDLCILPSSIHEIIVVPYNKEDNDRLNSIVKSVNEQELTPCDVLSSHIYIFSREDKFLHIA